MGFGSRIDTYTAMEDRKGLVEKLRESLQSGNLSNRGVASISAQIIEHLGCIAFLNAEFEKGRNFVMLEELPLYHDHIIGG